MAAVFIQVVSSQSNSVIFRSCCCDVFASKLNVKAINLILSTMRPYDTEASHSLALCVCAKYMYMDQFGLCVCVRGSKTE